MKFEEHHLPSYDIAEQISRSSSGVIFKASWKPSNRPVALKILAREASEEEKQRFLREIRAIARLSHPTIVKIYEANIAQSCCYYAMEFIDGESFIAWLNDEDRSLGDKVRVLWKVAEGLAYAHAQGFIHRDLRPENILVDKGGEPHLIDFRFAKNPEQDAPLTMEGEAIGNLLYSSPEQAMGRHDAVTAQSDVYSLGVVLYEILTGRIPFFARTTVEFIHALAVETPEPPRSVQPDVPESLQAICMRALERDLERRYASAAEFASHLALWLDGREEELETALQESQEPESEPRAEKAGLVKRMRRTLRSWFGGRKSSED